MTNEQNPYRQDGPLPLVEDQQLPVKSQRQMTQEYMQTKWQKLLDALTHEQQLVFCDNVAAIKILNAVPRGKYRCITDEQMAANLNMFLLRRKVEGTLCHCGAVNSETHFEVCKECDNISKMTHYRHNGIRDVMHNHVNTTSEDTQSSKEPNLGEFQPTFNTNKRADFELSARAGKPDQPEVHGVYDIMTKAATSRHTEAARQKAVEEAHAEGITDIAKIWKREIQAALQIGYESKLNKYKDALAAGIKINPLLISTAGTMHKAMHKFFKKLIPNANQRSCVLMDIAIFLAKGRGQIYSRNLEVLEMVAAAEAAAVMM